MGGQRLSLGVLQHIGAHAVQHAARARDQGGGVLAGGDPLAARLAPDQPHLRVGQELGPDALLLVNLSGRGDKDVATASQWLGHLGAEDAPAETTRGT